MCTDWIHYRPVDDDLVSVTSYMETFHRTLLWSTVPDTSMRLETLMTPDLEGRLPPHERTIKELLAFFPESVVLDRLFHLKEQVDPNHVFDGSGTIPVI